MLAHVPKSSRTIARRLKSARGKGLQGVFDAYVASGGAGFTASGSSSYSGASGGVPPVPKSSTGNDRADEFRKKVHSYAAAAALAEPELAPFIGAGVAIIDAWISVSAALYGESWDGDSYQEEAAAAIGEYLKRGWIPPSFKGLGDIIFIRDYAGHMHSQLAALTAQGSPSVANGPDGIDHAEGTLDPGLAASLSSLGAAMVATLVTGDPEIKALVDRYSYSGFPAIGATLWHNNSAGGAKSGKTFGLDANVADMYPQEIADLALLASKNWHAPYADVLAEAKAVHDHYFDGVDPSVFGDVDHDDDARRNRDAILFATIWQETAKYAQLHGSGVPQTSVTDIHGKPIVYTRAAEGPAGRGSVAEASAVAKVQRSASQAIRARAARQPKSKTKAALAGSAVGLGFAALVAGLAVL